MGNRLIFLYFLYGVRARTEKDRPVGNGCRRKYVGRSVGIKRVAQAEVQQVDSILPRKVAGCV